jgi:hypothetical protein
LNYLTRIHTLRGTFEVRRAKHLPPSLIPLPNASDRILRENTSRKIIPLAHETPITSTQELLSDRLLTRLTLTGQIELLLLLSKELLNRRSEDRAEILQKSIVVFGFCLSHIIERV